MQSTITFTELVRERFDFLESEYGYKIASAENSETRPFTDGAVRYTSNSTKIIIDSETGQASVQFLRNQDEENFSLDPVMIHEYLHSSDQEKKFCFPGIQ
jgi:hypothetical protein